MYITHLVCVCGVIIRRWVIPLSKHLQEFSTVQHWSQNWRLVILQVPWSAIIFRWIWCWLLTDAINSRSRAGECHCVLLFMCIWMNSGACNNAGHILYLSLILLRGWFVRVESGFVESSDVVSAHTVRLFYALGIVCIDWNNCTKGSTAAEAYVINMSLDFSRCVRILLT